MSKEREYQELYDRLLREVSTLHRNNRRWIRHGMRMLVAVTLGLMLLMFLAEGNKVFTLMLWIFSMFAVAAYLIAVEYADYELQKKLEYVTQMEQESLGALLELPELPEVPKVGRLLRREERKVPERLVMAEKLPEENVFNEELASMPEKPPVEELSREADAAPKEEPAKDAVQQLLSDPAQLAADLDALTRALQGLSDTLRRSTEDTRKEDDQ